MKAVAGLLAIAACGGAPPAPALVNTAEPHRITVEERLAAREEECSRFDTTLRLVSGSTTIDEKVFDGQCTGACTFEDKEKGAAFIDEIQAKIERGEATDSELDYDFTGCKFSGARPGRIDQAGGRTVALLVDHYIGPHSVEGVRYLLALEHCNRLFVSTTFGEVYVGGWALEGLRVEASGQQLVVHGTNDTGQQPLYRVTLPACPAKPVEAILAD